MSARADTVLGEIAALRERCEALEAENAWLKAQAAPPDTVRLLAAQLSLAAWCAPALHLLMTRQAVAREVINDLYEPIRATEESAAKRHHVAICRIRRALKPHGLRIQTIYGWGYRMPAEDRDALRAMLEQVAA